MESNTENTQTLTPEMFTTTPTGIDKTLQSRSSIYGDYRTQVELRSNLMGLIDEAHLQHHGYGLNNVQKEYFWDILNKLTRVAITPDHQDTWHDIAGYATLIERSLKENNNAS